VSLQTRWIRRWNIALNTKIRNTGKLLRKDTIKASFNGIRWTKCGKWHGNEENNQGNQYFSN